MYGQPGPAGPNANSQWFALTLLPGPHLDQYDGSLDHMDKHLVVQSLFTA